MAGVDGNISYVLTQFPINERPVLLASYTVCTFKLGALCYVGIEGSVAISNIFVLLKGKLRTDRRWDVEDGTVDNT